MGGAHLSHSLPKLNSSPEENQCLAHVAEGGNLLDKKKLQELVVNPNIPPVDGHYFTS